MVQDIIHHRRRIIVCLDGTWETPQEKSNVYKFYNNIDTNYDGGEWEYKTDYYPGLGTNGSLIILGGAFGFGISDQILSAYKYICKHYQDEQDEIWLVGFSRGAYAARSLSGLIHNVGVLPESSLSHADKAYEIYRDRSEESRPGKVQAVEFRERYGCRMPPIQFLGCFDTVGSLGVPKLPWYLGGSTLYSLSFGLHGFHDTKITPNIKNAYHAISIHDQREWFCPTLMHPSSSAMGQTLEQVWFPGMHQDVGGQETGSYDNLLSSHSLQWMMEKAQGNGLKFKENVKIDTNDRFIYSDSYDGLFVYKVVPRKDRVIGMDQVEKKYTLSQLYKRGQFTDYITPEQLAMYKSKTLDDFKQHLQQQQNE